MYKWLEEQGEYHSKKQEEGGPVEKEGAVSMSTLPPMVSRVVSRILGPYLEGSRGKCVLGLLLRSV